MLYKWSRYFILFTGMTCCSFLNHCMAQATSKARILALSKADHTLSIIDAGTLKVLARVPVGPDPHEVIASSDGNVAYVSNMGGGRLHELNIIDLTTQKALPNYDTGPMVGLHGLAFSGGKLWFTAEGAKAVGRYDPKTGKTDWIMGTGQNRTHMIYVTPDEKQVYTTNVESGTVSILEQGSPAPQPGAPNGAAPPPGPPPQAGWMQTIVPVSRGSEGFDVSPDGKELWTASADDGKISVIDLAARKVSQTIDAKANGANRLKFTPDGKRVMVSSLRLGEVIVIDALTRKEIKRIPVGHGAAGILMAPDSSRAFVACTPDNYIAVIDLKTLTVAGHIEAGGEPDGLAWAGGGF